MSVGKFNEDRLSLMHVNKSLEFIVPGLFWLAYKNRIRCYRNMCFCANYHGTASARWSRPVYMVYRNIDYWVNSLEWPRPFVNIPCPQDITWRPVAQHIIVHYTCEHDGVCQHSTAFHSGISSARHVACAAVPVQPECVPTEAHVTILCSCKLEILMHTNTHIHASYTHASHSIQEKISVATRLQG